MFTFVTITYNHENFIIQHLESVKYQILSFGEGKTFQLVVSDDCSTDNTINLIKAWTKENSFLFQHIDILKNKMNMGTCKNYTKAIRNIKGDFFKALAGDDLFAKDNIFNAVEMLQSYDIILSVMAPFDDKGLDKGIQMYSRIYSVYKFSEVSHSKLSYNFLGFPMTPGIFMRKELYTEQVLSFIDQYLYIEDLSASIKICEDNNNLKIGYYDKITALYRHHSNAITKTNDDVINVGFANDLDELDEYVLKVSSNIILRLRIKYNSSIRNIKSPRLAHLLNVDTIFYRIGFILNYHKYRNRIKDTLRNSFLPNEDHLKYIISEADRYKHSNPTNSCSE